MRISEAIAQLSQLRAQYGDLEVTRCDLAPGEPEVRFESVSFEVIRADQSKEFDPPYWVIGDRSEDILVCY